MRTIVHLRFGSHLYGTATPASDLDYKAVFVPTTRDILLRRGRDTVGTHRPKAAEGEKNVAGEVDEEAYSLQRYLALVAEGQTVALDVLFAPRWAVTTDPLPEWDEIVRNRYRLLTRRSAAFLGYCRQQANKYGIKGSRVAAAREAFKLLGRELIMRGTTAKLLECEPQIANLVAAHEHMSLIEIEGATDVNGARRSVRHWEVCNRKMPLTQTIKSAHEVMRRIVDEYGHRARQAASNQGVDWKALSHAVRVGRQAIELLDTGFVTFPRPEAAHLVAIKTGTLPYQAVAEEIEGLLTETKVAAARSNLPDTPDLAWVDEFVAQVHLDQVRREAP